MTREEAVEIMVLKREKIIGTASALPKGARERSGLHKEIEAYTMSIAALQEPERKRGRWIKISEPDENDNIKCRCSECHAEDVHSKSAIVPFCWNCGADMRGEQK